MATKHMVILFGGQSPEHDISILSFKGVYPFLPAGWKVFPVYITKNGSWFLQKSGDGVLQGRINQDQPCTLERGLDGQNQTRVHVHALKGNSKPIPVDFVFIVLHGEHGEDGRMQGYLDMLGVPYSGCGAEASMVCMNKDLTKRLCQQAEIPVTPWVPHLKGQKLDVASVAFKLPWMIKPSRSGSSIGNTKVKRVQDIPAALTEAFRYDTLALIEPFIQGREIECGVLEDPDLGELIASEPCEIIPGDEFYTYADKYLNDKAKLICPTNLDEALKKKIQGMAKDAFRAVGGSGFARCDFFVRSKDEIYLSELNTIPGFTPISMFPKMFEVSGLPRDQLLAKIITVALRARDAQ